MEDPAGIVPFLPAAYDWVWTVVVLLTLAAVVDVLRRRGVAPVTTLTWVVVALFLPLLGPALWFAWGRRAAATSGA
ncbi:PLD nuclease N-terminal domain-containing protein [Puerhibacterium puerhi]|uniref:PLD nuclease N-terminal domain-containing protein n=1 Tax=Puerhibacterium puerhi TaxID=2692623 RepID=UPI00135A94D6|nr:PLD nuclease N-terminal domain-containing protein [Puerhibacterium puerhi]